MISANRMFKSRKSQITIFIIIGIILLFSSALIIYIKNKVTDTTPPLTVLQSTPEDLTGMKKYIEDCIYDTGKQAVILIGAHGGYIYPEKEGITVNPANPTENSKGVEMISGSGYIVPYWYYLSSPNTCANDCQFSSEMPPLIKKDEAVSQRGTSIESQVSDYVTSNFKACLNNFEVYRTMGYEINELGPIETVATVTQEDVIIDVTWPIEAGRGQDKLRKLDKFVVKLPVNLKQSYDFAQLLIKKESETNFVGTNTLNLITYHSDKSKEQLPPMADFTSQPQNKETWQLDFVNKRLSTILFLYNPLLRIRNTENGINYGYNESMIQMIMDKMIFDLNDNDTRHPLDVDFRYSEKWPIYLDVTPKNGAVLSPKSIMGSFGVLGMMGVDLKQYEFQYDISYPLIIKLDDPAAFNGDGYSFLFAIETNIRNNRPLNASFNPLSVSNSQRSFVCDEQQKNSGNITVNSFNASNNAPLEGVNVVFSFSKQGCDIGVTEKKNASSKTASLTQRYPEAIGELTFSKQDYLPSSMLYAVKEGKTDEINVSLYPIIEKKVELKFYHMDKKMITVFDPIIYSYCTPWEFNQSLQNIRKNETVIITINKVKTFESPGTINGALNYDGSKPNYDSLGKTMKLAPGRYEVMIVSIMNENLTLPRQELKFKDATVVLNATNFNPHNEGIMQLNNETFYLDVMPEDLYTNKTLRFYALAYDLKSVHVDCRKQYPSDMTPEPNINKVMKDKKGLLMPRFI